MGAILYGKVQSDKHVTWIFRPQPSAEVDHAGFRLIVRVRGNGSKGPSPWTDTTTIGIN